MGLADGLLDGLGYVGDTLDKFTGGRAVRGLFNGRPRELLSVLPFSDAFGITDESQKASGHDVLKNFGLSSDTDPGAGVKSFLAEAILDPGTLLGGVGLARRGLKGGLSAGKALAGDAAKYGDELARVGIKPSLGLKFDHLEVPPEGMLRTDPDWLNNRTFFHGTGTQGITPDSIDPMLTNPRGLHGRGFYTTAQGEDIPTGYAKARTAPIVFDNRMSADKDIMDRLESLHGSGQIPDTEIHSLATALGKTRNWNWGAPNFHYSGNTPIEYLKKHVLDRQLYDSRLPYDSYLADWLKEHGGDISKRHVNDIETAFGLKSGGTVYQYQPNITRGVLDLDEGLSSQGLSLQGLSKKMLGSLAARVSPVPGHSTAEMHALLSTGGIGQYVRDMLTGAVQRPSDRVHKTGEQGLGYLRDAGRDVGEMIRGAAAGSPHHADVDRLLSTYDPSIAALRHFGIDALTHTGGTRTGNDYHQVLIHLDPAGKLGLNQVPNSVKNLQPFYELDPRAPDFMSSLAGLAPSPSLPGLGGRQTGLGSSGIRDLADFPMMKMVRDGLPKIVGGGGYTDANFDAILDARDAINSIDPTAIGGWHGFYNRGFNVGAILNTKNSPLTTRHERYHGIVNNAAKNFLAGDPSYLRNLPLAMRIPAITRTSERPLVKGLATILEELGAQTFERRHPLDQIKAASNFLLGMNPDQFDNRAVYGASAAIHSPLASALFQNLYRTRDPMTWAGLGLAGNTLRSAAYPVVPQGPS